MTARPPGNYLYGMAPTTIKGDAMTATFSARQNRAYKNARNLWPFEAAGLVRVYVGKGARRSDLVGLYNADLAGMDADGGAWVTVCERHSTLCNHTTRALADRFTTSPENWCEECEARYTTVAVTVAEVAAHLNAVNERQAARRAKEAAALSNRDASAESLGFALRALGVSARLMTTPHDYAGTTLRLTDNDVETLVRHLEARALVVIAEAGR